MGAKAYILVLAAFAATGCAGGLKRLAPPGIVKYEDRAKGQAVNPAIEARIAERRAEGEEGGFPNLSEEPSKIPEGIAKPERTAMESDLLDMRDQLNEAVALDRAAAEQERTERLEDARDALGNAVLKDDAAARRERGLAPRKPDPEQE
jgi:hypothetical protein